MASIKRQGKKWTAEIRRKKIGYYKAKSFFTKKEAERWARAKEGELDLFRDGRLADIKSFGQACQKFVDEISPSRKSHDWEVRRNKFLQKYSIYNVLLRDFELSTAVRYARKRLSQEVKTSTVNREMTFIRKVVKTARREWGWLNHDPFSDWEDLENPKPRKRRPSETEIAQIVEGLRYSEDKPIKMKMQQIAVVYLIAIETAMRMGEILSLEWKQVHLDLGYLELFDTKNGDDRLVALSIEARRLFERMIGIDKTKVFTVGASSLDTMFRKVMKRKNIKGLQFRDSRKEGTARIAKKLPVMDLAKQTGHRDLKILLNTYYHPDIKDIAAMMD